MTFVLLTPDPGDATEISYSYIRLSSYQSNSDYVHILVCVVLIKVIAHSDLVSFTEIGVLLLKAVRNRPKPSGRRLDQSRVESVQDQHETCDAVLCFAIYSRICFCIT